MFGFQTAEVGKTVHLKSEAAADMFLRSTAGTITNVSRDAKGDVAIIFARVGMYDVALNDKAVLTVVP
jgi:hypothetical protein